MKFQEKLTYFITAFPAGKTVTGTPVTSPVAGLGTPQAAVVVDAAAVK